MNYSIQVGFGPKGAYRQRHAFDNKAQAFFYYRSINIGRGFKKRLVLNGKVIARMFS